MQQSRRTDLRVDFIGGLLGVAGLGLLVAGFIEQPRHGWGSPLVASAFLGRRR